MRALHLFIAKLLRVDINHLLGIIIAKVANLKKKIVMIGDPAVGKTSLINRFVSNVFGDEYLSTIGTKITKKIVKVPNTNRKKGLFGFKGPEMYEITFSIWDVAGQKTFISIKDSYYRGAKGAIIVCDLTRKETLKNMPKMVASLKKVAGDIPLVFCANKADLKDKREFQLRDVAKVALPHKAPYYLTSAKTGANVEKAFKDLGKAMVKEGN